MLARIAEMVSVGDEVEFHDQRTPELTGIFAPETAAVGTQ